MNIMKKMVAMIRTLIGCDTHKRTVKYKWVNDGCGVVRATIRSVYIDDNPVFVQVKYNFED